MVCLDRTPERLDSEAGEKQAGLQCLGGVNLQRRIFAALQGDCVCSVVVEEIGTSHTSLKHKSNGLSLCQMHLNFTCFMLN